ncbi:MAG: putative toxin-antitoxin system toxin component, PIN family [bacterium]
MLVTLDTSVIISAFIGNLGPAAQILKYFKESKIDLALSVETLRELKQTIAKPSIKALKNYNSRAMAKFIPQYKHKSQNFILENVVGISIKSRDATDNVFLDLASISGSKYLVSLDKDLLVVKNTNTFEIIDPWQLLNELRQL